MRPDKRRALVEALMRASHPLSGEELARHLHVSTRSIRTYVSELNARGPVIVATHRGYALDPRARARMTPVEEHRAALDTPDGRLRYVCRFLAAASEPISIYELAERLYVSDSTLEADLGRVREVVRDHDLALRRDHELIYLDGSERSRRRLVRQMVQQDEQGILPTWHEFSREYAHLDLERMRSSISQIISESDLELNEYALTDLLLHTAITVERIRCGNTLPGSEWPLERKDEVVDRVCGILAATIENQYAITLPPSELDALYGVLAVRAIRMGDRSAAEAVIDPELKLVASSLLDDVAAKYMLGPPDPAMLLKLTLHVQNLVVRARSNLSLRHPLGTTFKNSHPFVHDLALDYAQRLEEHFGITVGEAEIAYLALHMGMQYLRYLEQRHLLTMTLVVPGYYDMADTIAGKLESALRGRAVIERVETTLDVDFGAITSDLIVSCVVPAMQPSAPLVHISPLLPASDLTAVNEAVDVEQARNMRRVIRTTLVTLIDPALFIRLDESLTKEQALKLMCGRLVEQGYVGENYLEDVLDRERRSSTSFGGEFAIPHSLRMDATTTAISVLVSEKGIPWGSSSVRLVMLFALSPDGRQIFRDGLDQIIRLLSETGNVSTLLEHATDAEAFLASLRGLLDH
ncbi:MAG: PTS sugar transporter subunit IIA [Propioniciclava sp.]|uniref:BglG family transcription antiterminator n=1 Tax=Propioniciclava sp. TaxID=2038686 RepID=UPI0039E61D5F